MKESDIQKWFTKRNLKLQNKKKRNPDPQLYQNLPDGCPSKESLESS